MKQKSLIVELAEVIARHWPGRGHVLRRLARALVPHPGTFIVTLLAVGAVLFAQQAGALPMRAPMLAGDSTTTISYQGRLADSSGDPVTTSGVGMQFRLYNTDTGGSPLWEETHAAVPVEDGLFHVLLGSTNPIPVSLLANNSTLWLGITVGSDSEMTPREQIASVPYAMVASQLASRGPGMIQSWEDQYPHYFDAMGPTGARIQFDTGIDVTVANGETKYYLVTYEGYLAYSYEDRDGTKDSFYGSWYARLVDGATLLGKNALVLTGYRVRWDAVGNNVYWNIPFKAVWLVELGGGVHSLDIVIHGYSDNTMVQAGVDNQMLQAIALP